MGKLANFKRIVTEDFDEKDRPLVSKLASAINIFADDVLSTLTNRVSIEDNMNITKKDFTVTVNASGNVTSSASLKSGLDHNCEGITVIRATNLVNANNIPTGTPFVTFSENNGLLTIRNVSNLVPSQAYKLKLILF